VLLERLAARFRVALLRLELELFLDDRFATAALRPDERFLAPLLRAVLLRDVLRAPPRDLRALVFRPPVFRPRVLRPLRPPALELFLPRFEPPRDDFLAAAMIFSSDKEMSASTPANLL
jgi:hypothetical protein